MTIRPAYKSTTLRCNVEDDDCAVCKFLNGGLTISNMLEVIRILDLNLASQESVNRELINQLTNTTSNRITEHKHRPLKF